MDLICISHRSSWGFTDLISGISPQAGAIDITMGSALTAA